MRYELKSISTWSYIKVMFFVNLIVGFVLGIFYGIFTGAFLAIATELMIMPEEVFDMQGGFPIAIYVFVMGFLFSMGNAVFGTIAGAVIVGFYNLIVRMTGGLEFVLNPVANTQAAGPIAAPLGAQAGLESLTIQPIKAKQIVPPPPPPVSGSAKPANAETDPLTDSTATPAPPPPPPKEAEKDNDKFKPPDYLSND